MKLRRVFAACLAAGLALGLGTPARAAGSTGFIDVSPSAWYAEAAAYCRGKGLMNGTGSAAFSPAAQATRAEAAQILMNLTRGGGLLLAMSAMDVMCAPCGIAYTGDGDLMVTDTYHKTVWLVHNAVSAAYAGGETAADPYGEPLGGYNDAGLLESYFSEPWAIAPFLDGWAVSDADNNAVRLIRDSSTQTVNATTSERLEVSDLGVVFHYPTGLAADDEGNLYVADTLDGAIRKITPDGIVTTAASGLAEPMGLCWADGVLYAAETGANRIISIVDQKVSVVAGSGEEDLVDGPAGQAAFAAPRGITVGPDGTVYVADTGNSAIRCLRGGVVSTLAVQDLGGMKAGLVTPVGLLVAEGKLYICDNPHCSEATEKSALGKAMHYLKEHWPYLLRYRSFTNRGGSPPLLVHGALPSASKHLHPVK